MSVASRPASEPPDDPHPGRATAGTGDGARARARIRSEYSLLSLVELSRALWSTHDIHQAAECLLLNLMGQIGTAQSALWLTSDSGLPVVIRCHGIDPVLARALVASCWTELSEHYRGGGTPIPPSEIKSDLGDSVQSLARQARVALLAPLCPEDAPVGLVALGLPVGRSAYTALELEVIGASVAIAGLAIRSAQLRGQSLEAGRTLRRANEELRQLDRLKSQFIDNVNHELRTPLSVVLGCLQCLSVPGIPGDEQGKLIASATTGAETLLRLVERLLTFSESSGGSLALQLGEADLSAFMTEYHRERRPGVSAGLRELELECDEARRMAHFDPLRLRQVVDELVDNAAKFSPPGSTIRLRVSNHVEDGRSWVRVSAEDEGIGIAPDRLPHLFESFRQVDGSMTRRVGGLGIGLVAARQLTEAMGGRITVESEEDGGSVFSVLLPAA